MAASAAYTTDPSLDTSALSLSQATSSTTSGLAISPTLHPNLLRPAAFRFKIEAAAHANGHSYIPLDINLPSDHTDPNFHPVPSNPFEIAHLDGPSEQFDPAATLTTTLDVRRTTQARFEVLNQPEIRDPGLTPLSSGASIWNLPLGEGFSLDGRGWRREIDEDQRIFVVGAEAKLGLTHFLDLRMGYELLRTQAGSVGLEGSGENDGMYAQFRFRF